jgi:hypothetical protein
MENAKLTLGTSRRNWIFLLLLGIISKFFCLGIAFELDLMV